jgi:pyruvate/2-oxoglutarate dehydrogenase complex dihydrolipoamide acyltransferase (E2) component
MEVETDKAAVVIPSPFSGIVETVHVRDGQLVHVGDVMVTVGDRKGASQNQGPATSAARTARTATDPTDAIPQASQRGFSAPGRRKPASPAVRKLARSMGLDIESIAGSGPGGRVQRADLELVGGGKASFSHHANSSPETFTRLAAAAKPVPPVVAARVHHAPLPDSLVVEPAPGIGEDGTDAHGPIRRAPLTQARKTIAAVMSQSWSTIPHATDFDDADVTELEQLRKGYAAPDTPHKKLTMLAFVIRAVVRALQRFPEFNASIDLASNSIIYKRYINIAVGVHTERGLVPMVLRDADRLTIPQISDGLHAISEKARTATFGVNDTRGGTYTISNAGAMGGSRYSTPIITPPQVAVLALGRMRWMPWVTENQNARGIAPRLIMPLSHSIDHRLLDGGQEVQFMQQVIGDLQNPARLLL